MTTGSGVDFMFEVEDIVRHKHGQTHWRVVGTGITDQGQQCIAKVKVGGEKTESTSWVLASKFVLVGRPCEELNCRRRKVA